MSRKKPTLTPQQSCLAVALAAAFLAYVHGLACAVVDNPRLAVFLGIAAGVFGLVTFVAIIALDVAPDE